MYSMWLTTAPSPIRRSTTERAIQAAIDAVHASGGGVVVLDAGIYGVAGHPTSVGSIHLKDNVFLKGAGMGETTLRVVDGWDGKITGIVRTERDATSNYGLADLTLDWQPREHDRQDRRLLLWWDSWWHHHR